MLSSTKCNRCKTERLNCMIKVQTPLCFTSTFFQFREIDEVFLRLIKKKNNGKQDDSFLAASQLKLVSSIQTNKLGSSRRKKIILHPMRYFT